MIAANDPIMNLINLKKQQKKCNNIYTPLHIGEDGKFIIKDFSMSLINIVLSQIKDFTQSNYQRIKSTAVLKYIIEATHNHLQDETENILYVLYKNSDHEEKEVVENIKDISNKIGVYFNMDTVIPTICRHVLDNDIKNNTQVISNRLLVFSNLLLCVKDISINNIKLITNTLKDLDVYQLLTNDYTGNLVYVYVFNIYSNIVNYLKYYKNNTNNTSSMLSIIRDFHEELFYQLLLLSSAPLLPLEERQKAPLILINLSKVCGFNNINDLYSLELSFLLEKFNSSHKSWRRNTADRFAFDAFVKNAGEAIDSDTGDNWIKILEIISDCTESNKDIELRMDMLVLTDKLIEDGNTINNKTNLDDNNNDIANITNNQQEALNSFSSISFFSEFIIEEVLLPASLWKAQRPNNNIRKIAIVCLIKLYKYDLVKEQNTTVKFFNSYISMLKSASDDDWDCELRNLSIQFIQILLIKNKENNYKNSFLSESEMRDLYPILLKRLDDSQDENRKAVCFALELFMMIVKDKKNISSTACEYIFQNSCIHLDDCKEEIRKAVYSFLNILISIKDKDYDYYINKVFDEETKRFQNTDYLNKLKESFRLKN